MIRDSIYRPEFDNTHAASLHVCIYICILTLWMRFKTDCMRWVNCKLINCVISATEAFVFDQLIDDNEWYSKQKYPKSGRRLWFDFKSKLIDKHVFFSYVYKCDNAIYWTICKLHIVSVLHNVTHWLKYHTIYTHLYIRTSQQKS